MAKIDYEAMFDRAMRSRALLDKALRECQLLLCPDFGTCADGLEDGEKCACGFEGGPYANAVPKNRATLDNGQSTSGSEK